MNVSRRRFIIKNRLAKEMKRQQVTRQNVMRCRVSTIAYCHVCNDLLRPGIQFYIMNSDGSYDAYCRMHFYEFEKEDRNITWKRCGLCHMDKPEDASNFYRKLRGQGFMGLCRRCKDRSLRKTERRICRNCNRARGTAEFSPSQYTLPMDDMAICLDCESGTRPHAPEGFKHCSRCNDVYPLEMFYFSGGRHQSYCKECQKAYNTDRYATYGRSRNFAPKSSRYVDYLMNNFSEEELLERFRKKDYPKMPDSYQIEPGSPPLRGIEYKNTIDGFQLALGLKPERSKRDPSKKIPSREEPES